MTRHKDDKHNPAENYFSLNEISIFLYAMGWEMPERLDFCAGLNKYWLALDTEGEIRSGQVKSLIPNEE
jgi:hypothetical protein